MALAISDTAKFNETVKEALAKSQNFPRWQNAINKAVVQIELNGEFMTFDAENKSLLIWSQESNDIHAANGICDCEAYKRGFPCWHRAAARIVRIYFEALETATRKPEFTYLPPTRTNLNRTKIGGVWID